VKEKEDVRVTRENIAVNFWERFPYVPGHLAPGAGWVVGKSLCEGEVLDFVENL